MAESMPEPIDLVISLHRFDGGNYSAELRLSQPGKETDIHVGLNRPALVQFDFVGLEKLTNDPAAYGQALSISLFADQALLAAFAQARSKAQEERIPLRMRLVLGSSTPELHGLRWETLRDPAGDGPLFTQEGLLFSRYFSSLDWRPVSLRSRGQLRALAAVANPSNLGDYRLAAIDMDAELERVRQGLGEVPLKLLTGEDDQRATLENILETLRESEYDIFLLICHGALVRAEPSAQAEPWLWLEDSEGRVARVSGRELVSRMQELQIRPRLALLFSCQSSGSGAGDASTNEALAALGPRLAEAGIPAVIAMQGNISLGTVGEFMTVFMKELQRDGLIDRAVSVARGKVRQRNDYWMPALFMRLKSGRIWYDPGFNEEMQPFKWSFLLRKIEQQVCTPILGPGLIESLLGSPGEVARAWAKEYHYPLEPSERESLPQVAQYLTVDQYPRAPYDGLQDYLQKAIQERYADSLPPELSQPRTRLDNLIMEVGAQRRKQNPLEPHRVLAELRLPIYITANFDNLLAAAIQELGNDPQVVLCPWNEYVDRKIPSIYDNEPGYQPSPERPLVYHLFGRLSEPKSVVLTEDDYFRFLTGVTRNHQRIPKDVLGALVDSALLMLGFHIDDWQFRVLFHSLLNQPGNTLRDDHPHIAVQLQPEEERTLDPRRAREYLERYYGDAKIRLFWGTVEDFIRQLAQQRGG